MRGSELVRRVRKLGRARGISVQLRPERGKGSHATLYFGERHTVIRDLKDELKTGTLHARCSGSSACASRTSTVEGTPMSHEFAYPAHLSREPDGYVVTFRDVPEAITQGDDLVEALGESADALEEAIAGRIRRGDAIPPSSPTRHGERLVAVPAQTAAKAALYLALTESGISRAALASRLHCDEKEVRRLLDPRHPSKLPRLQRALAALGKRLAVRLEDEAA